MSMQAVSLTWQKSLLSIAGFAVKSPVSGQILPLSAQSDLLYSQNQLPLAFSVRLNHGEVKAPFACQYARKLDGGRRLCFNHAKGLRVQLELPEELIKHQGRGLLCLAKDGQQVTAGQPLLMVDLQQFSQPLFAIIMLSPHPAIADVHCAQYQVEAAIDPCLIIQLRK